MKAYLALMAVVGMLVGLVTIERPITERRFAARSLGAEFAAALEATKEDLRGATARIAGSQQVAQNLAWQLDHSVDQFIEGQLRTGQLDGFQIFDEQCQPVAPARSAHGQDCPRGRFASGRDKEALFWRLREGRPALTLASRVDLGGKSFMTIAEVSLGESWVGRFAELSRLAARYDFTVTARSDAAAGALIGGAASEPADGAVLASRDPWFLYASPVIVSESELLGGLIHVVDQRGILLGGGAEERLSGEKQHGKSGRDFELAGVVLGGKGVHVAADVGGITLQAALALFVGAGGNRVEIGVQRSFGVNRNDDIAGKMHEHVRADIPVIGGDGGLFGEVTVIGHAGEFGHAAQGHFPPAATNTGRRRRRRDWRFPGAGHAGPRGRPSA